jgi:spore germination protein YaaH
MGYGEHWNTSDPGSAASLPWLANVLNYAQTSGMSPDRLDFGLPLYGYDWNTDEPDEPGTGLTYTEAQSLVAEFQAEPKFDSLVQTPFINYTVNGDDHQVWFENRQSVEAKVGLIKSYGIANISFWRLGGEDPSMWDLFKSIKNTIAQ